jgi:hypothetical protein
MALVDVLQSLGLRHVQLLSVVPEKLRQLRVADALHQVLLQLRRLLIRTLWCGWLDPLDGDVGSGELKGELALHGGVGRSLKVGLNEIPVAEADGKVKSLRVALIAGVDRVRRPEEVEVVWRDEEVDAAVEGEMFRRQSWSEEKHGNEKDSRDHVQANSTIVVLPHQINNLVDCLELQ